VCQHEPVQPLAPPSGDSTELLQKQTLAGVVVERLTQAAFIAPLHGGLPADLLSHPTRPPVRVLFCTWQT
jgi:hypothetical protein